MNGAIQALRDNPGWARQPKEWFRIACWAHRYVEDTPSRDDIAKALTASKHGGPRAPHERKDIAA